MILPKNKYRAFGYFGMATFYYVAFASQLLAGMIPRGSGDPAKYYRENTGFFWTYISLLFLVFFYQAVRGVYLYWKRLRHDPDPVALKGFSPRTASIITSAINIPIGLCFLILPLVELIKQTAYGGYVFGSHSMTNEPAAFWGLAVYHVVVAFVPLLGGALLFIFPPKHVEPVPESVQFEIPNIATSLETVPNAKPEMKTGTKLVIGAVIVMVLLVFGVVGAVVGGSYYLFKRIDDPVLVKKREAARTAGTEFAKTTDQNGCMEKAYTLAAPADTFDMSNHYFVKACIKASRPTPHFCDGVPFILDRDWFKNQCDAVGHNNTACIEAYTAKRDFCRLDADD